MTIRIVLAEDNPLLRQGLSGLIATAEDVQVLATAPDLPQLLEAIDRWAPDVVLTDIRMPPTHTDEGLQAARYCRARHPRTGVLLLSQYADPTYVRVLLEQGTEGRGYLLKERVADVHELLSAMRTLAGGGSVVDPLVVEALVRNRARTGSPELTRLSGREREVLAHMARGRNNASIAADLFISGRAVEKHINSIFAKLGVSLDEGTHPRVRAVLLYLAEGTR
ncbi:MAG TPA: response regulator transcription factor [Dermatophilaceae bacterium]|nr:response regulator transcription factor [Dermatophilaceae bacterium]